MLPASKLALLYPTPGKFLRMKHLRGAFTGLCVFAAVFSLLVGILLLASPGALNTFPATLILSIVGALTLGFLVITLICAAMYLNDAKSNLPYEARPKWRKDGINDAGSPRKVFFTIFGTVVWLVLLNLFWSRISSILCRRSRSL